jgi:hypothetical protein
MYYISPPPCHLKKIKLALYLQNKLSYKIDKFPYVMKTVDIDQLCAEYREKSSHGQKMRLPPTKISLPVKNNVDKAFVFVGNTN